MTDMHERSGTSDIHVMIVRFIDDAKPFALAVVLDAQGSTPAKVGMKAIVEADGRIHGTIGGGKIEATAQQHAVKACRSRKGMVFDFEFAGPDAASDMPVCGGRMRILIDPNARLHRGAWAAAAESLRSRRCGVLLTKIMSGTDVQVQVEWLADGVRPGEPLNEHIDACVKRERTECVVDSASGAEVLIEPVIPRPMLIIAGGGHVGQAVAVQAQLVGFDVTVLDDRSEFADPERFPAATRTLCGDMPTLLTDLRVGPGTYVVIVTRGHRQDGEVLRACIDSPAAYIGMIGSKRKIGVLRADLLASGITAERFDRVFAPIGLDIGAVTVPEIAASIVGQLVAVRRKGVDAVDRIRVGP